MKINLYTDDRVLAQINHDIAYVIDQLYELIAMHEPLELPQVINDVKYYIERDGL